MLNDVLGVIVEALGLESLHGEHPSNALGSVFVEPVKCVESLVTPMLFTKLKVGIMAKPLLSNIDAQKIVS